MRYGSEWAVQRSPIEDFIGHGTAVSRIIMDTNSNVDLIVFRICDEELVVDESGLVKVLEYIHDNIEADIINISAGITHLTDYNLLNDICFRLTNRNIIIISAFDNDGAISFPASLDCVIGVDIEKESKNKEIIVVENGIANILVPNKYYRTEWLDSKTIIRGTSFACAYISGLLSLKSERYGGIDTVLQTISSNKREYIKYNAPSKPDFIIQKAIIFPVNKESHAVMRFKSEMGFKLAGVYDDRLSGKVGKTLFGETIRSFDDINWQDDFDTIILSCVTELSSITRRNYVEEIIYNAEIYGKCIYSFEKMPFKYKRLFYPEITRDNVPIKNNYKLHKTIIPTVCVAGTSSKQGKFTMQQKIIFQLSRIGYNVGSIITEPSGYLFNADYVFHFGYHANLELHPYEFIAILNEMIFGVQLKQKDILLTGCQSGVIHYNNSNINEFAISQYSFLLGTLSDIFILCVNPHDDCDYIRKSIGFLNSIDEGRVRALAVFPQRAISTLSGIGYKVEEIDHLEFSQIKQHLESEFDLPVFSMEDDDISRICTLIIDEFSSN
jgi:uncharacterized NAD-dependent epimerase/dehydratase family protein